MPQILTLKKRKDFLRVAKGVKVVKNNVILQAAFSLSKEETPAKIGYTATKRLGKAHVRNKVKRRLRSCIRNLSNNLKVNIEYTLIGRHNTATCDFSELSENIKNSLTQANKMLEQKNEK